MKRSNCLFCLRPLDNSDEHIIPDSMNGKLHSTNIICSICNNAFGRFIDPIFKEILNPVLIVLGFENANHTHAEGLDEIKYNYSKKGEVSPLKDEVIKKIVDGKTILTVSGGAKSALKTFQKQAKKLSKEGQEFNGYVLVENVYDHNSFKINFELNITPKLIIALNKIATEFYFYCNLNVDYIKELTERVIRFDKCLNNVTFCNWKCDIREYEPCEITHLLVLRTNNNKTLYCYIELFNIICACIPLCENYPDDVNYSYYQNVMSGEKINKDIHFNNDVEFTNDKNGDFDLLINSMFERLGNIRFQEFYLKEAKKIVEKYKTEKEDGIIPPGVKYVLENRLAEMIAQLSVEFPYMIEDFKDEMNNELNHIHSILREEQYEDFCEKYKFFIGKDIKISGVIFKFDSFIKTPFIKRNGILLLKVYFCLINQNNGKQKYYPYAEFFRMLNEAYPNSKMV
ncbi:MAG: hypothetical protein NTW49_13925 [Bacteroidia bacterium]|nr:hypothetical protein [Bacteroidia bacterium]